MPVKSAKKKFAFPLNQNILAKAMQITQYKIVNVIWINSEWSGGHIVQCSHFAVTKETPQHEKFIQNTNFYIVHASPATRIQKLFIIITDISCVECGWWKKFNRSKWNKKEKNIEYISYVTSNTCGPNFFDFFFFLSMRI